MWVHLQENLKFESLGRALLQAEDDEFAVPDCAWNEETQTCGLFPLVAVDLLAQAPPSPVKDLIVGVVVMHSLTFKINEIHGIP